MALIDNGSHPPSPEVFIFMVCVITFMLGYFYGWVGRRMI